MTYFCRRSANMEKSGQKSSRPISLDAQDYQPRTGMHDLFISPAMYSRWYHRYNSITRFNADPSRARPRRKSLDNTRYSERRTDSTSSSSSTSPATPSVPLPRLIQSPFSSEGRLPYDHDSIPWHSSSSPSTDDSLIFNTPISMSALDIGRSSLPATPPIESYQGIDVLGVNQALPGLTGSSQLLYSDAAALSADVMYNKAYMSGSTTETPFVYSGSGAELYQNYPAVYHNDLPTQFFEPMPNHADSLIGFGLDVATSPLETRGYNFFKMPSQSDLAVSIQFLSWSNIQYF